MSDLVPLLPEDFNVITMYQQKANKKIKSDISTFYAANKNNITIREVLTLLTFADSQKYYLSKFGVDTTVVDVLNADLLKHYRTMVRKNCNLSLFNVSVSNVCCSCILFVGANTYAAMDRSYLRL